MSISPYRKAKLREDLLWATRVHNMKARSDTAALITTLGSEEREHLREWVEQMEQMCQVARMVGLFSQNGHRAPKKQEGKE